MGIFSFSRRATRAHFFTFLTLFIAIHVVATWIDIYVFRSGHVGILGLLTDITLLLPTLTLMSRRLYDSDHTDLWLFLLLVPVIGWLILLFLWCYPSTEGDNRFGPHPTLDFDYDEELDGEDDPVAQRPRARPSDYLADLERLAQLREKGIVREDEFNAMKEQIISEKS